MVFLLSTGKIIIIIYTVHPCNVDMKVMMWWMEVRSVFVHVTASMFSVQYQSTY